MQHNLFFIINRKYILYANKVHFDVFKQKRGRTLSLGELQSLQQFWIGGDG